MLVPIARLREVAIVHAIGFEQPCRRAQRIRSGQILLLILIRTPTLVVAQSIYHRVGGFGFRRRRPAVRQRNPEASEADAEAILERTRDNERHFGCKNLTGTINFSWRDRVERRAI